MRKLLIILITLPLFTCAQNRHKKQSPSTKELTDSDFITQKRYYSYGICSSFSKHSNDKQSNRYRSKTRVAFKNKISKKFAKQTKRSSSRNKNSARYDVNSEITINKFPSEKKYKIANTYKPSSGESDFSGTTYNLY